jgi:hypothetical protein
MLPAHIAPRRMWLWAGLFALASAQPVAAKPKTKAAAAPATTGAAAPAPAADGGEAKPVEPEPPPAASEVVPAPAQTEKATPAPPADKTNDDAEQLASLRADVAQLVDDMARARSAAALLGKTLFKTQLRLLVQNLAGPDPLLAKLVLKLDGVPVFQGDSGALYNDEERKVFEGFISPGAHVLTAELEQKSRQDAAYGYTLHDSYRFQVRRDKRSDLTLIIDDDSDLASDYPDDGRGEYDVRLKLRVRTRELGQE